MILQICRIKALYCRTILSVSLTNKYPFSECQRDEINHLYNIADCMLCYKNETMLNEIINTFAESGGSWRVQPSIPLIKNCLDQYLPTLLTSEQPTLTETSLLLNVAEGIITGIVFITRIHKNK